MLRFKDSKTAKKFWIAVIFLTTVAGVMLIAYPLISKANMAAETITTAEETKAAAQKKVEDYQAYQQNYSLYEEAENVVSTKFPQKLNNVEYTAFVQRAAREAGLPTRNVTELTVSVPVIAAGVAPGAAAPADPAADPAASAEVPADPAADPAVDPAADPAAPAGDAAAATPAAGGNMAESTVSITATGTMTQLNGFANELMSGVRDFTLTSYNVSAGEGSQLTATIDGKALFYREVAPPANEVATEEGN